MRELEASSDKILQIGYEGEDNVTTIKFLYDEEWLSHGNGEFKVRVLRNGDTEAYNATQIVDDRESMALTMTVTDIEFSKKGRGELQLVYVCVGAIKKSQIYRYNVNRAIDSEVVDPPESSVINEIIESLAGIRDEIGNLDGLTTTDKSDLVSAINEVNAKEVTVDSELSGVSENPVQNKVIKNRFDGIDQTVVGISGRLSTAETTLEGKANTADVNTALSTKANTSDVNTALSVKADKSYVDTEIGKAKADLGDLDIIINGESSYNFLDGKNINVSGAIIDDPTRCVSEKIPYTWTGSTRYYSGNDTSMGCRIAFYDAGDNLLKSFQAPGNNAVYRGINAESQVTGTVAYVRFSWLKDYTAKVTANTSAETPVYWSIIQTVESEGLLTTVEDIQAEVREVKADLNDFEPYNYSVTDNLYSPKFITTGYRLNINTGDLDEVATHSVTNYIPVTAGETLYVSRLSTTQRIEIQSSFGPRICFYDAEKVFIENSGIQDSHATVPLNAKYMRFSAYNLPNIQDVMIGTTIAPYVAYKTIADDYKVETASLRTAISSAQNDITDIAYINKTDSIGAELAWTSGYVTAGGNIRVSDSYHYSESISVTPGDVISTGDSFRFVTVYVNGSAVESLGAEYVTSYTVPDMVTAVIVTLAVSKTSVNHTYKVIFDGLAQHVKAIEDKIDGATFDNDETVFRATAASLTNGEVLEACSNIDNKKNDTIIFYANLDAVTFGSVTVGHGYNISYGASVTVDATKITIAYGTNANYYNANHGLTIDKFLMIKVKHTDNARADIQIETANGQFNITASAVAWGGCRGSVFALSTNSTLTNIELSSTFADFEQNIFLFGDSYVSLGDNARYSTILISNGYTNLMIDGYGGRNSANAMLSFRQVLAVAKPKFVIWALGMNDSDSSTAINVSYKSCLDEVIALCETYGVTPILTTIPNTPTRINTFKNTYVKSLGYRFIDFAKAVGAEESGSTWWNGMLEESDNPQNRVHPTVLGAQALYARFLIDVPEIADAKFVGDVLTLTSSEISTLTGLLN